MEHQLLLSSLSVISLQLQERKKESTDFIFKFEKISIHIDVFLEGIFSTLTDFVTDIFYFPKEETTQTHEGKE